MEIKLTFIVLFKEGERLPSGALADRDYFVMIDEEDEVINEGMSDYEDIANEVGEYLSGVVSRSKTSLDISAEKTRKKQG